MADDPYFYPETNCLINDLGIADNDALNEAQGRIVAARDVEIASGFLPGTYNLEHLQRFHSRLFGDVYLWAGRVRTVDIAKDDSIAFCPWQFIEEQVSAHLAGLQGENLLIGYQPKEFIRQLAHYYGGLNACHPFRDGNGRTIRAFLRQLCAAAGYILDWSEATAEANVNACRDNMISGEATRLETLLSTVVRRI